MAWEDGGEERSEERYISLEWSGVEGRGGRGGGGEQRQMRGEKKKKRTTNRIYFCQRRRTEVSGWASKFG